MNGRVYDPVLGRFLSADPNIDGVEDAQGYNRYSYVGNNPMNATDPSGYFKLKEILPAVIGIIVAAVAIVTQQYWVLKEYTAFFSMLKGGIATLSGAMVGGAAGGFASSFSGSLLNGGSIGDAFKAGVIGAAVGAATAWAAHGIGGFFDDLGGAWADGTFGNWAGRTLAHATVGGAASAAQGGQFRHGFYSSAASTGFMHAKGVRSFMGGNKGGAWIAARTAVAATIGGTASVLAGGKFANGAVTSAFQHLFNAEGRKGELKSFEKGRFSLAIADGVSVEEILDDGTIIAGNRSFRAAASYYGATSEVALSNNSLMILFDRIETSVSSVALFFHGEMGGTGVGSIPLTDNQWAAMNGKMVELYLFGCNVADGVAGANYVQRIANLTGATVHATPYLTSYTGPVIRSNYGPKSFSEAHTVRMITKRPQ